MKHIKVLSLFFFLQTFISYSQFTPFTVIPNLNNSVTVIPNSSFISFYNWDLEYGPVGFVPGSGNLISSINGNSYTLYISLFSDWEFRIKNSGVQNAMWTDKLGLIASCSSSPKYIGYNYNFNTDLFNSCWRGYRINPGTIYQSDLTLETNSFGTSVKLYSSENKGVMLVSPRLEDLSTDKKITFKCRSNYTNLPVIVGTLTDPEDPTTFHPITSFNASSNGNFTTQTMYFNNLYGSDKYVGFKYQTAVNQNSYSCYIDDFEYSQSVNCFDATDFQITNVMENSASFTFNNQNQTNWEVNYGIGTNTFTYQSIFVSGPFTLTNLWGLRDYNCRIRAVCEPGHYSNWSPTISFTTPCTPMQTGYYNGFEDFGFNNCWNRIYVNLTSGISHSIAPNGAPVFGNYMCTINSNNEQNTDAILVSTYIDNFTDKRIRFKVLDKKQYMSLQKVPFIVGTLSNPNDASTFVPLITYSADNTNPLNFLELKPIWQQFIIDFNGYNIPSNHHYLGFKNGKSTDFLSFYSTDYMLEEFYYESSPLCKEPVNIQVEKYENDLVKLSWSNSQNSSANQWQIEYGPEGFALGTGTQITSNSNIYTIQNLTASTSYDFYVRTICGAEFSGWSSKINCKTRCEPITVGYTTSFETDNLITGDSCWRIVAPKSRIYGIQNFVSKVQMNSPSAQNGSYAILVKGHPNSTAATHLERIFVSPKLADFNNQKMISFWVYIASSSMQSISVGTLSNPDDYTTFTTFREILPPFTTNQWVKIVVDFSSYNLTDQYIGIRQKSSSNSSQNLYVDSFSYYENPCLQPNLLSIDQLSANSVKLNWQANIPGATNWQIEYGISGFTPGNGTIVNSTTNPHILTGLQENKTYQFRVRNICTNNSINWSEWYTFKTACVVTAPYYEKFDQYNVITESIISNPETFCWTSKPNPIVTSGLNQLYLNNVNSSPNVAFVTSYDNSLSYFVSPFITNFNNSKRLRFWAFKSSPIGDNNTIVVGTMKNPLDNSTFTPFTTIQVNSDDISGKEFNVDFSTYTGTDKHIAFQTFVDSSITNPTTNKIFIDNIIVDDIPQCREPLNFKSNYTSSVSTQLSWTDLNGNSSFLIEYGPYGFIIGTGSQITTNDQSVMITNLSPNTRYVFYIKSICGNNNSVFSNSLTIDTPCLPVNLPWNESFNALPMYGQNRLPNCFTSLRNDTFSFNSSTTTTGYSSFSQPDGLITGSNDTSFIYWEPYASIISPVFNLVSGTTYKLNFMGRREYEYSQNKLLVEVLKGHESYYAVSNLFNLGTLSEYYYSPITYYYTPMENSEFSFKFTNYTEGNRSMITDTFQLSEGYNTVINQPRMIDFSQNLNADFILEKTETSDILLTSFEGNSVLKFAGGNSITANPTWMNSQKNVSKLNFKINPTNFSTLALRFSLKQTFVGNPNNSAFRVVVNGTAISPDYLPNSPTNDNFITYQFDLSNYINQGDIRVSLQHRGFSTTNQGDSAYIDNLEISNVLLLNTNELIQNKINVYPNPTDDIINFMSEQNIDSISITNLYGAFLNKFEVNKNNFTLSLNNYASGIYFATVKQNDNITTYKIIKH